MAAGPCCEPGRVSSPSAEEEEEQERGAARSLVQCTRSGLRGGSVAGAMEEARVALLSKGDAFDVALLDNVRCVLVGGWVGLGGWVIDRPFDRSNVCV